MPNTANSLPSELLAVAGFSGNNQMCVTPGASINMAPIVSLGTVTVTLLRKPATSTASILSNSFTADVPGLYLLSVSQAGATANYSVLAVPAAGLAAQNGTLQILQNMWGMAPTMITAATAAASLELASPGGVLGGLDQRLFGGTSTNALPWNAWR